MSGEGDITDPAAWVSAPILSGAVAAGGGAIDLAWTAPASPYADLVGYAIYRSQSGGAYALLATVGPTTYAYTDAALLSGQTYAYKVTPTWGSGATVYSNIVDFDSTLTTIYNVAGSYEWTPSPSATSVVVAVVGGGGGGSGGLGNEPGNYAAGGGGAGGGFAQAQYTISALATPVPVTVGAGGTFGPNEDFNQGNPQGGTGGTSAFGSTAGAVLDADHRLTYPAAYLYATGGVGGPVPGDATAANWGGGTVVSGNGGTTGAGGAGPVGGPSGANGTPGNAGTAGAAGSGGGGGGLTAGTGGATTGGAGGAGSGLYGGAGGLGGGQPGAQYEPAQPTVPGSAGANYGGGGGGGSPGCYVLSSAGGAGAPGVVVVTEYFW